MSVLGVSNGTKSAHKSPVIGRGPAMRYLFTSVPIISPEVLYIQLCNELFAATTTL
jgi:hypothetical protein